MEKKQETQSHSKKKKFTVEITPNMGKNENTQGHTVLPEYLH